MSCTFHGATRVHHNGCLACNAEPPPSGRMNPKTHVGLANRRKEVCVQALQLASRSSRTGQVSHRAHGSPQAQVEGRGCEDLRTTDCCNWIWPVCYVPLQVTQFLYLTQSPVTAWSHQQDGVYPMDHSCVCKRQFSGRRAVRWGLPFSPPLVVNLKLRSRAQRVRHFRFCCVHPYRAAQISILPVPRCSEHVRCVVSPAPAGQAWRVDG